MDYDTAMKTARARLEELAFAMDPVEAAPALRAAAPKIADYAACTVKTVEWPVIGDDDVGRFAHAALGASIGLTGETYRFFIRQACTLLEVIARDCDERAVMVRGYVGFVSGRLAEGRTISLDGIPAHVLRRLVDANPPSDPSAVAALVCSLKTARADELAAEVLRACDGVLDAKQTRVLFNALDKWTRDWVMKLAMGEGQPVSATA